MLKLGLIGCGKMGGALLRGVEKNLGKSGLSVGLSDVVPAAVDALMHQLKCSTFAGTPAQVAAESDVVLLAVKPGDMEELCDVLAKVKGGATLPVNRGGSEAGRPAKVAGCQAAHHPLHAEHARLGWCRRCRFFSRGEGD